METISHPSAALPAQNKPDSKSGSTPDSMGLTGNSCYHDLDDLERILTGLKSGVYYLPRTRTAALMADGYGISLRTAYRHLRRGTTPATERKLGRDRKSHPVLPKTVNPVDKDLRLAWQALNRARKHNANDVELLTRIHGLSGTMLGDTV